MKLIIQIPCFNEAKTLTVALNDLPRHIEGIDVIETLIINDGSKDRSPALLLDQQAKRPDVTRVVLFSGNFGQHAAIMAGFAQVRGEVAVTLDADLQNPAQHDLPGRAAIGSAKFLEKRIFEDLAPGDRRI